MTRREHEPVGYLSAPALTHLLALVTWVLGPAIVYLVADDEYTKRNAANAIHWSVTLGILVALPILVFIGPIYLLIYLSVDIGLLALVLVPLAFVITLFIISGVALLHLGLCLAGIVKAANGKLWEYPFTYAFLSVDRTGTSR